MKTFAFISGAKYRVRFRNDNQRRNRVFIGLYLGDDYEGNPQFSLRPAAGTSSICKDSILDAEMVPTATICTQPGLA